MFFIDCGEHQRPPVTLPAVLPRNVAPDQPKELIADETF
jgi:hypothetical protein